MRGGRLAARPWRRPHPLPLSVVRAGDRGRGVPAWEGRGSSTRVAPAPSGGDPAVLARGVGGALGEGEDTRTRDQR